MLRNYNSSQAEISKLEIQIEQTALRISDRENSLDKVYVEESDFELTRLLANFDADAIDKGRELQRMQREIERCSLAINKERDFVNDLNTKKGQASSMKESLKQLVSAQLILIGALSRKFNIPTTIGKPSSAGSIIDGSENIEVDNRQLENFIAALNAKVSTHLQLLDWFHIK